MVLPYQEWQRDRPDEARQPDLESRCQFLQKENFW